MKEQQVKMTSLQRAMSRHMIESWTKVPQFQLETNINCEAVIELRRSLKYKPSFTTIIVKALANALSCHSMLNASFQDNHIIRYNEVNIGVAVDTPRGLLVPVIKNAANKSLQDIHNDMNVIKEKAVRGNFTMETLTGGTFTISNLGMFKVGSFKAIVNAPQAAILAISAIKETPIARNGEIIIGQLMNVSLSVDHRVNDGAYGARFLRDFVLLLEEPQKLG